MQRLAAESVDKSEFELTRIEASLSDLAEREKRLVHLYTLGNITSEVVRGESALLAAERRTLDAQLAGMKRPGSDMIGSVDGQVLTDICAAVSGWLDNADDGDRALGIL